MHMWMYGVFELWMYLGLDKFGRRRGKKDKEKRKNEKKRKERKRKGGGVWLCMGVYVLVAGSSGRRYTGFQPVCFTSSISVRKTEYCQTPLVYTYLVHCVCSMHVC